MRDMNFFVTSRSHHGKRAPLRRTLLMGCWCTVGTLLFTGCSEVAEVADQAVRSFNADASLLAPVTSTTYSISGSVEAPEQDNEEASPETDETSAELLRDASGTIVTSDGIVTSIELVASLESQDDLRFVLTEPALYERRGEPLESFGAIGTLITPSATYPDTRVLFTPQFDEDSSRAEATFDLPDSFVTEGQLSARTVRLELVLEPLATFDQPSSAHEGEGAEKQQSQEGSENPEAQQGEEGVSEGDQPQAGPQPEG
ncbi:hypothetical protein [Leucobacter chinensis]|uniref:hypothetical protein n=1 Tax=Leucobacter chinensis TaxID=2851010 RepID=UPI001C240574|nr:hypothetical protein [Leucobacter chinensis]